MADMGWTDHQAVQEEIEYMKWGFCRVCGRPTEDNEEHELTEVSHGPNEPAIGYAHVACLVVEDPQSLSGADHYRIDPYPDVSVNEVGEAE